MLLSQFIAANSITMVSARVDRNPNTADDDWAKTARHWRCTLINRSTKRPRRLTIYFSQGRAHTAPPSTEDVLDCLASDAVGYENANSFEDWATDYGYDTDSRKAEKTYRMIGTQSGKLKRFLGDEAYETLLWECERL